MTRILRYVVPVDDEWHTIFNAGLPLHVACCSDDLVEFWARGLEIPVPAQYRVYGTGHSMPPEAEYVGTALTPGGHLVWHLVTRMGGESS